MTCDGVRQAIPYRTLGRFLRLCGTVPGTASNPAASVQVVIQSRVPAVPQSGLSGRAGRDRLGTAAWLKRHPSGEDRPLRRRVRRAGRIGDGDFALVKRIVLEVCLLRRAHVQARDDLVTMLCKRMNILHNRAGELLEEIRAGQRERNERMLAVFGEVLKAAKAIDVDAQSPLGPGRRSGGYETGKAAPAPAAGTPQRCPHPAGMASYG